MILPLPVPMYVPRGEGTELDPTVCTIIIVLIGLIIALILLFFEMTGLLPTVGEIIDSIRSKTHKYIEEHKPSYIPDNLKTNERRRVMNPVKIKNEVHNVTEVIFKQVGNSMTGNITRYYMTDNPNILYRVDYKEWEFYTEEFVRRDQI